MGASMTADEKADSLRRLMEMTATMRSLRDQITEAADMANEIGATSLAFASHHLADSIAEYTLQLTKFWTEDLTEE